MSEDDKFDVTIEWHEPAEIVVGMSGVLSEGMKVRLSELNDALFRHAVFNGVAKVTLTVECRNPRPNEPIDWDFD